MPEAARWEGLRAAAKHPDIGAGQHMIDELGRQLVSVVVVLLLALGPVFSAAWFLQRRKRIARNRRRSPLTQDLLRTPGQALREQLDERRTDVGFDMAVLMMVPLMPVAFFHISSLLGRPLLSVGFLGFVLVCAAAFVAWQIRKMLGNAADMDKLRLGLDAELAVGQELDQLMREGAVVFHDLPAEKFNIDHVVIAPQGVFAVETKGYSKPNRDAGTTDARVVFDGEVLKFPDWSSSKAIEQAARQAKWLADWLSAAVGQRVEAAGVLALPGWYIERKGRGQVLVFSGKELRGNLLKARTAKPLLAEQMRQVIHQVEQRCRNVEPSYRPDRVQT